MDDKNKNIEIVKQKGCRCAYCHAVMEPNKFAVEHITPRVGVNKDSLDNIIIMCPNCNRRVLDKEKNRLAGSGIGGAMLGASIGGPVGAILGGVFGLLMGDSVNKIKKENIDG